jgi:hypothetical protein
LILAMSTDFRVAASSSQMGLSEAKIGMTLPWFVRAHEPIAVHFDSIPFFPPGG